MRISDWSSDVCSSDLIALEHDTAFGIDEIDRAAEPLLVVVDQVLNGIDGQTDTGDTDEVTVVIDNPIVDEDGHRVPVGQVRIDVDLVGLHHPADTGSEERRVGKEGVSTWRSRWSPSH